MNKKLPKFIEKLKKANRDFDYDYSITQYGIRLDKIDVICNYHGKFTKSVQQLERGSGCTACVKNIKLKNNQKLFVERANKIHSGKYCYDKVLYKGNKKLVTIICPFHGDFSQSPDNPLHNHGCRKCQYEQVKTKNSKTEEQFIKEAIKVHGDSYDYSLVNYKNTHTKVKIILPDGNTVEQTPSHHIKGFKPSLEPRGLDYARKGIIYYLKLTYENSFLFKIGITSKSIDERFVPKDLKKIEVLYQKEFNTIKEAFNIEQEILRKYKNFKYEGNPVLVSGNSEIFTEDIFKGNYDKINSMGKLKTITNVDV